MKSAAEASAATLRIGSRGSALALWQANWVKQQLEARGCSAVIEIIKTTGDRITDVPLAKVGSKGLFTKEIEDALLAGRVDLAVHSLKDLPTLLPGGVILAAIPEREDPRDVLISRGGRALADLPNGARIGTSSLRRAAQLHLLRADFDVVPLRGNLDTRLRKLDTEGLDGIILAAAGLRRLGWIERATEFFSCDRMCPAVGQGALGIEARAGDSRTLGVLAALDHAATRRSTTAERTLLAALGGGCQVPIGALGRDSGTRMHLTAIVAAPDGSRVLRATAESDDPSDAGRIAADQLFRDGARHLLEDVYGRHAPVAESP